MITEQKTPIKYLFSIEKVVFQDGKNICNLHGNGKMSMVAKFSKKVEYGIEYIFRTEEYKSKEVKEPLIFNPVKWVFDMEKNEASIWNKETIRQTWNQFKNKHRKPENVAFFQVLENLYFRTHQGFEYSVMSECPFLGFFINTSDIELNKNIKGLDWVLFPLNIPLNTNFKVTNINNRHITLDGNVSLDENRLDMLLTQERFRERAKSYHFSKNFIIDSTITVQLDKSTLLLYSTAFTLEIKGEDGKLSEIMRYEINQEKSY